MLRADLCYYSDAYIVVKGVATVTNLVLIQEEMKLLHLKIMLHLLTKFQRLIMY